MAPPGGLREASREHFFSFFTCFFFWREPGNETKTEISVKSALGRPPGGPPEAPSEDSPRRRYPSQVIIMAHFGSVLGAHFFAIKTKKERSRKGSLFRL